MKHFDRVWVETKYYRMPGISNNVSTRGVVKSDVRKMPTGRNVTPECPRAEILHQNFTQNASQVIRAADGIVNYANFVPCSRGREIARTIECSTASVIWLLAYGWLRNNTNTYNTNDWSITRQWKHRHVWRGKCWQWKANVEDSDKYTQFYTEPVYFSSSTSFYQYEHKCFQLRPCSP